MATLDLFHFAMDRMEILYFDTRKNASNPRRIDSYCERSIQIGQCYLSSLYLELEESTLFASDHCSGQFELVFPNMIELDGISFLLFQQFQGLATSITECGWLPILIVLGSRPSVKVHIDCCKAITSLTNGNWIVGHPNIMDDWILLLCLFLFGCGIVGCCCCWHETFVSHHYRTLDIPMHDVIISHPQSKGNLLQDGIFHGFCCSIITAKPIARCDS
mmetsp:Transcript_21530/g.53218  ORF Transcript_21530/g.53218 Transcript_21530/m.53218 type:complete len:218 (-) Transcript_21530:663-1316(-)